MHRALPITVSRDAVDYTVVGHDLHNPACSEIVKSVKQRGRPATKEFGLV